MISLSYRHHRMNDDRSQMVFFSSPFYDQQKHTQQSIRFWACRLLWHTRMTCVIDHNAPCANEDTDDDDDDDAK